jgi:hypothetical protein
MWCSVKKHSKANKKKRRTFKKDDLVASSNEGETLNKSAVMGKSHTARQSIMEPVFERYDASFLSEAKANWYFGEWQALANIELDGLQTHADVAKLAALKATGYQQLNDIDNCKKYIAVAKSLGCDNKVIAKLLIAGAHNSLGKLSALRQNDEKINYHFNAAVDIGDASNNAKLMSQARCVKEISKLGLLSQATKVFDSQLNDFDEMKFSAKNQEATLNLLRKEQLALRAAVGGQNKTQNNPIQSRLILIASMPRSGSTWLFNCAKEILARSDKSLYSCWVADYDENNPSDIHLVKVHDPVPELSEKADVILSTRRDIREVAASLVRMEWDNKGDEFISQLSWVIKTVHPYWFERTNLEIEYKQVLSNPELVVEAVGHALKVVVNSKEAVLISNKLEKIQSPKEYNKNTQLHPNHRATVVKHYSEVLSKKTIDEINALYGQWIDTNNYPR